jgi:hypothetical protein
VGGVGVFGSLECLDPFFCGELGASGAVDRDAGFGGWGDFGFVQGGGKKRDRQECLFYLEVLAVLVSAFVFFVLL